MVNFNKNSNTATPFLSLNKMFWFLSNVLVYQKIRGLFSTTRPGGGGGGGEDTFLYMLNRY